MNNTNKISRMDEFRELGIGEKLLKSLSKKGYETPTPIQAVTIPALLNGEKDIIGQAQTGTGKTAAFSLPILETIVPENRIQAIVLTPTRELALQVAEEMNSLGSIKKIKIIPVYGGQSIDIQRKLLKSGVDIVVGTPGRVIDLIDRKLLKIGELRYFILDEADEMLNMGFLEDVEKILEHTNNDKRMLFFSATMPKEIIKVAKKHMKDYEIKAVQSRELTTDLTDQIYYEVNERDKFEALCRVIDLTKNFYGIVFCRTKTDVNEIVGRLSDRGYDVEGLHGDIGQKYREVALKRFKSKKINVLVATDVAARGIDINNLSHVINYAIPQEAESYVHRIGRTGRAGNEGTAITFITTPEYRRLLQIQKVVKTEIRKEKVPGVKDVIQARKFRIINEVEDILKDKEYTQLVSIANELLEKDSPENVIAAILKHNYEDILDERSYHEISSVTRDSVGKVRLFVALGKKDSVTPKKIIENITKRTNVKESKIRNVEIYENFSFISVPFEEAEIIIESFKGNTKGRKPLIEKAKAKTKK